MGKGSRNREQRKRNVERSHDPQAISDAISELTELETASAFVSLVERRPEITSDATLKELSRMSETRGYGAYFDRARILLLEARHDPSAAWDSFASAQAAASDRLDGLDRLETEIQSAQTNNEPARALELIDQAVAIAQEAGHGGVVCELVGRRGVILLETKTERRAIAIDAAIESFSEALEIAIAGEQAASLLMHLGLAYGERINGDRADNLDLAVSVLRHALEQLRDSNDEELRAMVQTNLAVALTRDERQDIETAANEAIVLCQSALKYRNPRRNADSWAYSQINLGFALRKLAELKGEPLDDAQHAYGAVIEQVDAITDKSLVGTARHALGRLYLNEANASAEEIMEAHDEGRLDDLYETSDAVRRARENLETARELTPRALDPLRHGRILSDLSEALAESGDTELAVDAARDALEILRPTVAPEECKTVGWRLGKLLGEKEDWEGSAAAFRDAVEGSDITFYARMEKESRDAEARKNGNLYRWAAYSIAKTGDLKTAATVLDGGRGRELRRRLDRFGEEKGAMGAVPPALREEYRAAVQNLAVAPLTGDETGASRRLQEVLTAIRQLPGLEGFGMGPRWNDVEAGVESDWPITYVDPTPSGTLILLLWRSQGEVSLEAVFLDELTSNEIFMRLISGDAAELDDLPENGEFGSYLFGVSGEVGDDRDFRVDLDQALGWLGPAIARPLRDALVAHNQCSTTLVLCGPIGATPLHAAPWTHDGSSQYLVDDVDVRYAPSAAVCALASRRADQMRGRKPHLVALANPSGDLPAAEPEVREVATHFGSTSIAIGASADERFLRANAERATHLHLACHAGGGLFDATGAAIELASGPVSTTEITSTARLNTRLVVVSACQSAQSELAGLPDEAISIATAMLASGSACAIASLWPVDDLATAVLMTRLYEEMVGHRRDPPTALCRAQLWLRDLSQSERDAFLGRHPELETEYRRRVTEYAKRRGPSSVGDQDAVGPFGHPDSWAPFVAVGV